MIKKIYKGEFINDFLNSQYKDNFTYNQLEDIFDYYEEMESDTGEEIKFDLSEIAYEFTSFDSIEECANHCRWKNSDEEEFDEDEDEDEFLEWLEEQTIIISKSDGIVIMDF